MPQRATGSMGRGSLFPPMRRMLTTSPTAHVADRHPTTREPDMSGKNKGGRETRKPKQEQNKKPKGQTPSPGDPTVDAINHHPGRRKR
jgi:hypothetical protein